MADRIVYLETLNAFAQLTVTPSVQEVYREQWVSVSLDYTIFPGKAYWYIEMEEEGESPIVYENPESLDGDYFIDTCLNQYLCFPFEFSPEGSGSTSLGIRIAPSVVGSSVKFRFQLVVKKEDQVIASSPMVEAVIQALN